MDTATWSADLIYEKRYLQPWFGFLLAQQKRGDEEGLNVIQVNTWYTQGCSAPLAFSSRWLQNEGVYGLAYLLGITTHHTFLHTFKRLHLLNFFIAELRCAKRVNWWCLPKDGWTMTYAVKWMAWYTIHMMEVGGYKKPLVLSVAPISWHPFPYGGPSWFPPVPQLRFPSPIHPGFSTTGLGKKLIPFLTCSTI